MSEFIKEQWEVFRNETSNGYTDVISGKETICVCYGGFDKTKPHAKLIACAPEMLEMLIRISQHEYFSGSKEIENLINKATL
jgi:hypothetical protein